MSKAGDTLDALGDRKAGEQKVREIAAALVKQGIDVEELGRISRISAWESVTKNADGDAEIHQLHGFQLSPKWADGPEWPVVQQPPPVIVKPPKRTGSKADVRTVAVIPDPQIGYRRLDDGTLDPLHDEQAIACSVQLIRAAQPSMVVNLGDTLDFAEWSTKFIREPEFVLTTQPSIDRAYRYLVDQIAVAPDDCEHHKLPGNHDDRLAAFVTKNAMAALRLKQADKPESWPVLSIQHLLRLDELGVQLAGGFPAGKVKIADGARDKSPLFAMHGPSLDVRKLAKESRQSIIQGHTHRAAEHTETYEIDGQPIEVTAIEAGALARRDGAVPSRGSAVDSRGRVVPRVENWQHAIVFVHVEPDGYWHHEIVRINDGRAFWRGKEYGG